MKHYLYRHIRLDKYEPFYIGIGTKSCKSNPYRRSKLIKCRNNIWKNIISKTDYKIEILIESDDYEFIQKKEIEFIKLYGRKNLGTGCLANLTDGGDGSLGYIPGDSARNAIIESNKRRSGSKMKECVKLALMKSVSKKVINIKTGEVFNSIRDACKTINVSESSLGFHLKKGTSNTFKYFDDSLNNTVTNIPKKGGSPIPVINNETGEIFPSFSAAARYEKISAKLFGYLIYSNNKNFNYKIHK